MSTKAAKKSKKKPKAARVEQIRKRGPAFLAQLDDNAVLAFARHEREVRERRDADAAAAIVEEAEIAEFLGETPEIVARDELRLRDTAAGDGVASAGATSAAEFGDPGAMVPDLEVPAAAETFWFWVGLLPECPRATIPLCAGSVVITFVKSHESLHFKTDGGFSHRTPRPGQHVKLSRTDLAALEAKMHRRILRVYPDRLSEEEVEARSSGSDIPGKPRTPRPPRADLLQIPTEAEAEVGRSTSRSWRPYIPQAGDRGLADFAYIQFCAERPIHQSIDSELPRPLSETGFPRIPENAIPAGPDGVRPARGDLLAH